MSNDKESRRADDPVRYHISEIRTSSNDYDDMGVELYRAVCRDIEKKKDPPYTKWVATWILKCIRECFGKSVQADVLLASFALLPGYELKKSNRHARLCKYLLNSNYTQEKDGKKYPPIEQIVGENHKTIAYEILLSFWEEDTKKDKEKNKPRKIEDNGIFVLVKDIIGQKNEDTLEKIIRTLKRNERNYVKKIAFHVNCEIEFNDTEKHMQELDDYGNRTEKTATQGGKKVTRIEYEPKPEELVLTFPKESIPQNKASSGKAVDNPVNNEKNEDEKSNEKFDIKSIAKDIIFTIKDIVDNIKKKTEIDAETAEIKRKTAETERKTAEIYHKIALQQSNNLFCFYLSCTLWLTSVQIDTFLREGSLTRPEFVISSEWQKDKPQELPAFNPSKIVDDIFEEEGDNTNMQNQKKVNDAVW